MNKAAKEKPIKPPVPPDPPEDSVALRLVVFAMSAVCIGVSCFFVNTSPGAIVLYVFLLFSGSYLSYQHREEKNKWLHRISVIGCLIVGGTFINDLLNPYSTGQLELLTPFVHQVAGTFVCHSFELRSRNDLNFSSAIGLTLLCLTAPVARQLTFGLCVASYICLGAVMLYFDCLSRTKQRWLAKPIERAISAARSQKLLHRAAGGSVILTLVMVPLLTFALFLLVPRVDNLIDLWVAQLQNWTNTGDDVYSDALPQKNNKPYNFKENEAKQMGVKPKDLKDFNTDRNLAPAKPNRDSTMAARPPKAQKPVKEKEAKEKLTKDKKTKPNQSKEPKAEKEKPLEKQQQADKKTIKLKPNQQTNPDDDDAKTPASKPNGAGNKKSTPGNKPGDPAGKAQPGNGTTKADAKGTADGAKPGPGAAQGTGGTDSNGKGGGGTTVTRPGLFGNNNDDTSLSATSHDVPGDDIVLKVASNRTCYLKRCSYDTYDGKTWTNSIPADQHLDELKQPIKGPYQMTDLFALPKRYPGIDLAQDIEIESARLGTLVPLAWIPQQLSLQTPQITVDTYGAVRANAALKKGTHYHVVSKVPIYDLKRLRRVYPIAADQIFELRKEQKRYLELPASFDARVATLAGTIAGDSGNWFVQSERIANYLRQTYKYELVKADFDVADTTSDFMFERKKGDCLDFAGAFVMMTRSLGIPSRLDRGFSVGDLNELTGLREVKGKNAHAWAEVYFGDYGWIPFDATPQGTLPAQTKENSYDLENVSKKFQDFSGFKMPSAFEAQNNGGMSRPRTVWDWMILIASIGGCMFISVLVGKALYTMIKRYLADQKAITPEMKLYRQVLADLKRLKLEKEKSDTTDDVRQKFKALARERAKIGATVDPKLASTLDSFLDAYSEGYFGGRQRLDDMHKLQKEIHAMAGKKGVAGGVKVAMAKSESKATAGKSDGNSPLRR